MLSATFLGEVHQGRLHVSQPLTEFEGKQVLVTLIAPDSLLAPAEPAGDQEGSPTSPEAEVLEDAGRVRVPRREVTTVHLDVVDVGRRPMRSYSSDEVD